MSRVLALIPALLLLLGLAAAAQETPYFVTYSHHLEEPGNLELESNSTIGVPRAGQGASFAPYAELEYGVQAWWTSELYLEGQTRGGDRAIFTGWRLENRFRPLRREHRINPLLYFEFEDINEGSLIRKEIVGHSEDLDEPNDVLRRERAREVETKLILSSTAHDWNIAENFIVEKNLTENEGFEFGYAFGISRALARLASATECRFCRENFTAGVEVYGGLGTNERFGFADTAHYVAPVISWQLNDNSRLSFSPSFGLTGGSAPVLFRVGYSYEIRGFRDKLATLFHGGRP
ncbi:MAG TPA: hypothetical protein VFU76_00195 [Terriglobales bacterium]|nr:hypothetical protein [Terriglobales bacterium]